MALRGANADYGAPAPTIEVPDEALAAFEAGKRPVLFARIAAHEREWCYTNAPDDVEWDDRLWRGNAVVGHERRSEEELAPRHLTPIAFPRKKSALPYDPLASMRGHWRTTLTNLRDDWRRWLDAIGKTECSIWVGIRMPHGVGEWFATDTHIGPVVDYAKRPADGGAEVVVKSVDRMNASIWHREGYAPADVAAFMAHAKINGMRTHRDESGAWSLVLERGGRAWVVGRSAAQGRIEEMMYDVHRCLRDHPIGLPPILYKYIDKKWADQVADGRVLVSPDWKFKEGGGKLTAAQEDDERVKVTHLGDIIEMPKAREDVMMTSSYDPASGELTMESDPYWLWCASAVLDVRLFDKFGDSVVVITNPEDFTRRLAMAMRDEVGTTTAFRGTVDYERHKDFIVYGHAMQSVTHPAMLKNREYQDQQEFRVVGMGVGREPRKAVVVNMGDNSQCARVLTRADAEAALASTGQQRQRTLFYNHQPAFRNAR